MLLSLMSGYFRSYKVDRSIIGMRIWLAVGAVRWAGMTKTISGGLRMPAQMATYLIFQFKK